MILSNCNIIDLENGEVHPDLDIQIESQRIKDIGKNLHSDSNILDMQGSYLLPGLFNMHNNLSMVFPFRDTDLSEPLAITVLRCYRRADDALKAGITSLRTVGEQNRVDLYLKKMINTGWVRGSRIFAGGKGLGRTGGHGSDFGQVEADGPAQFERAAKEELSLGADHLKVFITGGIAKEEEALEEPQMTREEMAAVVSVVRAHRTYVAAHAGGSRAITVAAEAE